MVTRNPTKTLAGLVEAAAADQAQLLKSHPHSDIVRLPIRMPRAVREELGKLAAANGMSVSLAINLLIDGYLMAEGRPGYAQLAPWYPDYVLRVSPKQD